MPPQPSISKTELTVAIRVLESKQQPITARSVAHELGTSSRSAWRALQRHGIHVCPTCQGRGRVWGKAEQDRR